MRYISFTKKMWFPAPKSCIVKKAFSECNVMQCIDLALLLYRPKTPSYYTDPRPQGYFPLFNAGTMATIAAIDLHANCRKIQTM